MRADEIESGSRNAGAEAMGREMAGKAGRRKISKADLDMGKRIRLRRLELKMSLAELGEKLGVTFQQVQKYENGSNRVTASRLLEAAKALEAPLSFFLAEGPFSGKLESALILDDALGVRLVRAFSKIRDKRIRHQIVLLAEGLTG